MTGFFHSEPNLFTMKKRITIQGVAGCFHEAAAKEYFANEDIETIPCETFPILFDKLKYDASLLGIVAIENTIAGSLLQNQIKVSA